MLSSNFMSKPRIIIADDHTMLVEAFEKLLAPECDIVAKAVDGRALVSAVREHRPDVVVLDVAMPLLNGLDAGRQIKQFDASIKLVFVTMNEGSGSRPLRPFAPAGPPIC